MHEMGHDNCNSENYVDRLRTLYGIDIDPEMSKKIDEAFQSIKKLKEDYPEIDLNYVVTGKKSDVTMKSGMHNFSGSKVDYEDKSMHYNGSVVITCPLSDKMERSLNESAGIIRNLVDIVSELKMKD